MCYVHIASSSVIKNIIGIYIFPPVLQPVNGHQPEKTK